jgi:hypothetical protein
MSVIVEHVPAANGKRIATIAEVVAKVVHRYPLPPCCIPLIAKLSKLTALRCLLRFAQCRCVLLPPF